MMKNLPFILFVATLYFAPLAFGSVELWSMTVVQALIFLTVIIYYFHYWKKDFSNLSIPGVIPLVLIAGWICLQLIPLPIQLVKILSPASWEAYRPVINLSEQSQWIPLTVDRKATVVELLRISSYILFYVITIQLLSRAERVQKAVQMICILAICLAFLSILMKFTSPETIYWFRPVPENAKSFGVWVNRSQYSGFMTMICPLVLALFFYFRPTVSYKETLRVKIVSFFTMPESNQHLLLGFGAVVIFSSVFLSISRGGIIALCLSTFFFFFLLAYKKKQYSLLPAIIIAVCFVLSITWFGWQPIVERFDKIVTGTGEINIQRFTMWQDSLQIIKDFPFFGSGFGTFESIYPMYRTVPGEAIIDHAHNDYLELLTDGGLIGFFLVAWFIISMITHAWKTLGRRRDSFALLVGIGALSGLVAFFIYGVTDFNFHNGADGLYFFFFCGLFVSATNSRLHYRTKPSYLEKGPSIQKKIICVSVVLLLGATVVVHGGGMLAEKQYGEVKNIYLNRNLKKEKLDKVARFTSAAMKYDPLESLYPAILGDIERYRNNSKRAIDFYVSAARKEPMKSFYLQQIGLLLSVSDRQLAGTYMEQSYVRSSKTNGYVLSLVEWLLWNNERLRAIDVLRKGYLANPRLAIVSYPLLHSFSFTREETRSILPISVEVWVKYGLFLKNLNDNENAKFYLSESVELLNKDNDVPAGIFNRLYRFYKKEGQNEKAIEIVRQGISRFPNVASFHVLLGDYYLDKGIIYQAENEYKQAMVLDPDDRNVLHRIESMKKEK